MDNIFSLRQLKEKRKIKGRKIDVVFVDLVIEYNTVPRSKIYSVIEIKITRNTLEGLKIFIRNKQSKNRNQDLK